MDRLKEFLAAFPKRVLELLLQGLLLLIYFLVALPVGLLWRLLRPHPSWTRATATRWEEVEAGRDPTSLEQAGRQY